MKAALGIDEKVCRRCLESKSLGCFYKYYRSSDGHQSYCKACILQFNRERPREVVRAAYLRWIAKNPERAIEMRRKANRRWMRDNKKAHRESTRLGRLKRYKTDLGYRLKMVLRCRQGREISRARGQKSARTLALTGCSIGQLRSHIESLFTPGMTWENYGVVWQIDHKKPCAAFDLSDPAQQKECFHWTNLQPLFAVDNRKKGATVSV